MVCGKEEGGSAGERREAVFYFPENIFYSFAECPRSGHSAKFFFIFLLLLLSQKRYFIPLPSVLDLGTRQSFFFIFFLLLLSQKKDFISLPSAKMKTLGKTSCLPSVFFDTRQTTCLPSVFFAKCF